MKSHILSEEAVCCPGTDHSCCQLAYFNNGSQVIALQSQTLSISRGIGSDRASQQGHKINCKNSEGYRVKDHLMYQPLYLAHAAGLSAPWTPVQRSEPDRRPEQEESSDSGSEGPPKAGRAHQTGWEQTLEVSRNNPFYTCITFALK